MTAARVRTPNENTSVDAETSPKENGKPRVRNRRETGGRLRGCLNEVGVPFSTCAREPERRDPRFPSLDVTLAPTATRNLYRGGTSWRRPTSARPLNRLRKAPWAPTHKPCSEIGHGSVSFWIRQIRRFWGRFRRSSTVCLVVELSRHHPLTPNSQIP